MLGSSIRYCASSMNGLTFPTLLKQRWSGWSGTFFKGSFSSALRLKGLVPERVAAT